MSTQTPEHRLTTTLCTVPPDARVREVAGLMDSRGVGAVIVVDGSKPVGILTDRDIVRRVIAPGLDADKTCVKEVMSSPVKAAARSEEVGTALALMGQHGIRRVPIVDENGHLVSIITLDDVILLHFQDQDGLSKVVRLQLGLGQEVPSRSYWADVRRDEPGPPTTPVGNPLALPMEKVISPSVVVAMERVRRPTVGHRMRAWFRHNRLWLGIALVVWILGMAIALLFGYLGAGLQSYGP